MNQPSLSPVWSTSEAKDLEKPEAFKSLNFHEQMKLLSSKLAQDDINLENQDDKFLLKRAEVYKRRVDNLPSNKGGEIKSVDENSLSNLLTMRDKTQNTPHSLKRANSLIIRVGGEIKSRTIQLEADLLNIKSQFEESKRDANALNIKATRMAQEINDAEGWIEKNRAEIKRLREEIEEHKENNESIRNEKGTLELALTAQNDELKELVKAKDNLQYEFDIVKKEKEESEKKAAEEKAAAEKADLVLKAKQADAEAQRKIDEAKKEGDKAAEEAKAVAAALPAKFAIDTPPSTLSSDPVSGNEVEKESSFRKEKLEELQPYINRSEYQKEFQELGNVFSKAYNYENAKDVKISIKNIKDLLQAQTKDLNIKVVGDRKKIYALQAFVYGSFDGKDKEFGKLKRKADGLLYYLNKRIEFLEKNKPKLQPAQTPAQVNVIENKNIDFNKESEQIVPNFAAMSIDDLVSWRRDNILDSELAIFRKNKNIYLNQFYTETLEDFIREIVEYGEMLARVPEEFLEDIVACYKGLTSKKVIDMKYLKSRRSLLKDKVHSLLNPEDKLKSSILATPISPAVSAASTVAPPVIATAPATATTVKTSSPAASSEPEVEVKLESVAGEIGKMQSELDLLIIDYNDKTINLIDFKIKLKEMIRKVGELNGEISAIPVKKKEFIEKKPERKNSKTDEEYTKKVKVWQERKDRNLEVQSKPNDSLRRQLQEIRSDILKYLNLNKAVEKIESGHESVVSKLDKKWEFINAFTKTYRIDIKASAGDKDELARVKTKALIDIVKYRNEMSKIVTDLELKEVGDDVGKINQEEKDEQLKNPDHEKYPEYFIKKEILGILKNIEKEVGPKKSDDVKFKSSLDIFMYKPIHRLITPDKKDKKGNVISEGRVKTFEEYKDLNEETSIFNAPILDIILSTKTTLGKYKDSAIFKTHNMTESECFSLEKLAIDIRKFMASISTEPGKTKADEFRSRLKNALENEYSVDGREFAKHGFSRAKIQDLYDALNTEKIEGGISQNFAMQAADKNSELYMRLSKSISQGGFGLSEKEILRISREFPSMSMSEQHTLLERININSLKREKDKGSLLYEIDKLLTEKSLFMRIGDAIDKSFEADLYKMFPWLARNKKDKVDNMGNKEDVYNSAMSKIDKKYVSTDIKRMIRISFLGVCIFGAGVWVGSNNSSNETDRISDQYKQVSSTSTADIIKKINADVKKGEIDTLDASAKQETVATAQAVPELKTIDRTLEKKKNKKQLPKKAISKKTLEAINENPDTELVYITQKVNGIVKTFITTKVEIKDNKYLQARLKDYMPGIMTGNYKITDREGNNIKKYN